MKYCLKIIKKDGDVTKQYFSSYEDLEYNATYCQFSTNIVNHHKQHPLETYRYRGCYLNTTLSNKFILISIFCLIYKRNY